MKPREQNWQSHPPATVSQARRPPSGGTNVTASGDFSVGAGGVAVLFNGWLVFVSGAPTFFCAEFGPVAIFLGRIESRKGDVLVCCSKSIEKDTDISVFFQSTGAFYHLDTSFETPTPFLMVNLS